MTCSRIAKVTVVVTMSDIETERSTPEPSGSAPVTVSTDQFTQLMFAIAASQSRMDAKLAQFQEVIWQGQEKAALRALKRACCNKPYVSGGVAVRRRPASMPRSTSPWHKQRVTCPSLNTIPPRPLSQLPKSNTLKR